MNWNPWMRQLHRWLSVAFTVAVIVTSVALAQAQPVAWMTYLPLPPLGLLWLTGSYLFLQPHVARWRGGRRSG